MSRPTARAPDAKVAAPVGATTTTGLDNRLDGADGTSLAELVAKPRPWSHRHDDACVTCTTHAQMTDRRRLAEIEGLRAGRRIVDLGAA
jgi:hypothetical protein